MGQRLEGIQLERGVQLPARPGRHERYEFDSGTPGERYELYPGLHQGPERQLGRRTKLQAVTHKHEYDDT
jgi:hypothetical protein